MESSASIDAEAAAIRRQLDLLAGAGRGEAASRMGELLDELMVTVHQIEDARPIVMVLGVLAAVITLLVAAFVARRGAAGSA